MPSAPDGLFARNVALPRPKSALRGAPAARGEPAGRPRPGQRGGVTRRQPTDRVAQPPASADLERVMRLRRFYTRPLAREAFHGGGAPSGDASGAGRGGPGHRLRRALLNGVAALLASVLLVFALGHHSHHPHPGVPVTHAPSPTLASGASVPHIVPAVAPVVSQAHAAGLDGVSLPLLNRGGNRPLEPIRLLLIVPATEAQKIGNAQSAVFSRWMASNENPASVVRILVTGSGKHLLTPVVPGSTLSPARAVRARAGTATRWLLARTPGETRRLAIAIGSQGAAGSIGSAPLHRIAFEPGAPVPSSDSVDLRRHDSLAAAVALNVAAAMGQGVAAAPKVLK